MLIREKFSPQNMNGDHNLTQSTSTQSSPTSPKFITLDIKN